MAILGFSKIVVTRWKWYVDSYCKVESKSLRIDCVKSSVYATTLSHIWLNVSEENCLASVRIIWTFLWPKDRLGIATSLLPNKISYSIGDSLFVLSQKLHYIDDKWNDLMKKKNKRTLNQKNVHHYVLARNIVMHMNCLIILYQKWWF